MLTTIYNIFAIRLYRILQIKTFSWDGPKRKAEVFWRWSEVMKEVDQIEDKLLGELFEMVSISHE